MPRQELNRISSYYRSGFSSLEMLVETYEIFPARLKFRLFSPLVEVFNEKSHQLLASGFIAHWEKILYDPKGLKKKHEAIGPQVLTMEHLKVGFLVCLCPLLLSVFAFLIEVFMSSRLSRMFYKHCL